MIGSTSIKNDRGSIVAVAGTHVSNQLFLDSDLGSVGSLASPFNVILVQYARGPPPSPTPEYPVVLHAEVGVDIFLNLTTVRRDSLSAAQGTAIAPVIGPVFAGHDIWININDSNEGIVPLVVHDGEVNRFVPNNISAFDDGNTVITASGPIQEHVGTIDHFRPNVGTTPFVLDGAAVLIAYAADVTPINADYQFCGVDGSGNPDCTLAGVTAGHNIDIHHNSSAASVSFRILSNDDATFTDADRAALVLGTADNNGRIDLKTNGSIIDTETSGDFRVGQIQSTGGCTSSPPCNLATPASWLVNPLLAEHAAMHALGDVTLNSPAAILDAESDGGVRGTDPSPTDVIGQNITMSADDNRLGLAGSKSGRGGVGTPGDFLEIQVNADAAALGTTGTLTVDDDTAARTPWSMTGASPSIPNAAGTNNLGAASGTFGVFLTQTTGTMQVNVVYTHGDASLATLAGSIRDARGGGTGDNATFLPNVRANNVDLDAIGGSIGDGAGGPRRSWRRPQDRLVESRDRARVGTGRHERLLGGVRRDERCHAEPRAQPAAGAGLCCQRPRDGARQRGAGRGSEPDLAVRHAGACPEQREGSRRREHPACSPARAGRCAERLGEPPRRRQHHARQQLRRRSRRGPAIAIRSGPVLTLGSTRSRGTTPSGTRKSSPASGSTCTATSTARPRIRTPASARSCTCTGRSRPAHSVRRAPPR